MRAVANRSAALKGASLAANTEGHGIRASADDSALLGARDFLEAAAIFALVVLATFPVVLPFMFMQDSVNAFRLSQGITLVMLFLAGASLSRHAGHPKPMRMGLAMAIFGAVLIAVVKALGG